jgi:hypothetical protein
MAGNLLGTIKLPISLSRSKYRIAALRQFRWLQHLSPIPDHFLQRDLNEAVLRRTLRVAGQVPITSQKRGSRRSEREHRSVQPHFLQPGFWTGIPVSPSTTRNRLGSAWGRPPRTGLLRN